MKKVKNGKASDQAFQDIGNGSEAAGRMMDETEADGGIQKFVDDLIDPLKKS
jgi:hypothetical protein